MDLVYDGSGNLANIDPCQIKKLHESGTGKTVIFFDGSVVQSTTTNNQQPATTTPPNIY